MEIGIPADIQAIKDQLDAAQQEAQAVATGLSEGCGGWRERNDSWSVAECFDHLAVANRVYVDAMELAARRAQEQGRNRRGPALPGFAGRWFAWSLDPPVKRLFRLRAPWSIRPRTGPCLNDAFGSFVASHDKVGTFLRNYVGLDLAGVRFVNPFIRGVRFSLATGLFVIAAHERRHLWQAWRVRRAAERTLADKPAESKQTEPRL